MASKKSPPPTSEQIAERMAKVTPLLDRITKEMKTVRRQDSDELVNNALLKFIEQGDITRTDDEIVNWFLKGARRAIKDGCKRSYRFVSLSDVDYEDDGDIQRDVVDCRDAANPETVVVKRNLIQKTQVDLELMAPQDNINIKRGLVSDTFKEAAASLKKSASLITLSFQKLEARLEARAAEIEAEGNGGVK